MATKKKGTMTPTENVKMKLAILEQVPSPIMAIDRDFNIVFLNPVGCRWLGKEWKDIVGKKCWGTSSSG